VLDPPREQLTLEQENQLVDWDCEERLLHKTTIKAYMSDNHRKWDVNLMQVALAIRTAVNESTGYSPFFLNTSRRYVFSGGDYKLNRRRSRSACNHSSQQSWRPIFGRTTKTEGGVWSKRKAIQQGQNKAVVSSDILWKKNYVLSHASKFFAVKVAPRFVNCVVVEKKSDLVYVLESMDERKWTGAWHIKDLKPDQ
jgi:hypothetical protein